MSLFSLTLHRRYGLWFLPIYKLQLCIFIQVIKSLLCNFSKLNLISWYYALINSAQNVESYWKKTCFDCKMWDSFWSHVILRTDWTQLILQFWNCGHILRLQLCWLVKLPPSALYQLLHQLLTLPPSLRDVPWTYSSLNKSVNKHRLFKLFPAVVFLAWNGSYEQLSGELRG